MIIIKQFEDESILVVDTVSLKANLWIKNLWYFATEAWLPWTATNWDYAIVWSTDTVWVWDSDTNAWKNSWTASSWDMMKSVYDTDNDWKVDAAETADSVEWAWVQNKPTAFNPISHTHDDRYYTDVEIDIALWLKQNALNTKQDALVSWTNIKTVNWNSLLWSGDIVISWWGGASTLTYSAISTSQTASVWVYYGVTCSNSNIILTIPNWTSAWDTISVKKLDNTSYWVILSWNIEIDTSYTLGLQFESIDLYWNWTYYLIK